VLNAQPCKYDMYKSSLRHIYDPVLSSLKMKGIRFFVSSSLLSSLSSDGVSLLNGNFRSKTGFGKESCFTVYGDDGDYHCQ
jgi:hypothetical protein